MTDDTDRVSVDVQQGDRVRYTGDIGYGHGIVKDVQEEYIVVELDDDEETDVWHWYEFEVVQD